MHISFHFFSLQISKMINIYQFILMINFILLKANCTICVNENQAAKESSSETTSYDVISKEPCFDISQFEYNQNKKAELEKPVELECIVKNKGAYSIAWMYENQLISLDDKLIRPDSNLKIESDSIQKFNLKLTHVDSNNKGSYRCQISTLVAKNLEYNLDILCNLKHKTSKLNLI